MPAETPPVCRALDDACFGLDAARVVLARALARLRKGAGAREVA